MWNQVYDPLHSPVLSTIAAAVPVVTLLVLIASVALMFFTELCLLRGCAQLPGAKDLGRRRKSARLD